VVEIKYKNRCRSIKLSYLDYNIITRLEDTLGINISFSREIPTVEYPEVVENATQILY